jgi:hypothetical protein
MPQTIRALSTMSVPMVAITDRAMDSIIVLAQKLPPSTWATVTSMVPLSEDGGGSTYTRPAIARPIRIR